MINNGQFQIKFKFPIFLENPHMSPAGNKFPMFLKSPKIKSSKTVYNNPKWLKRENKTKN